LLIQYGFIRSNAQNKLTAVGLTLPASRYQPPLLPPAPMRNNVDEQKVPTPGRSNADSRCAANAHGCNGLSRQPHRYIHRNRFIRQLPLIQHLKASPVHCRACTANLFCIVIIYQPFLSKLIKKL
jgi:hypothetical protein